jgi:hypothetical protein
MTQNDASELGELTEVLGERTRGAERYRLGNRVRHPAGNKSPVQRTNTYLTSKQ